MHMVQKITTSHHSNAHPHLVMIGLTLVTTGASVTQADAICAEPNGDTVHLSFQVSVTALNCQNPYTLYTKVEQHANEYLDDCGHPYEVDFVRQWREVYDVGYNIVYSAYDDHFCDDSDSGVTRAGTKPC